MSNYKFDKELFSRRLGDLIKDAGFTIEEFSEASGLSLSSLKTYLYGKTEKDQKTNTTIKKFTEPGAENLYKMAEALERPIENLLEDYSITRFNKAITPADIVKAINTLIAAFGVECIAMVDYPEACPSTDVQDGEIVFLPNSYNTICIPDGRMQNYLSKLKVSESLKNDLINLGEEKTYQRLLNEWANIEGCIFKDGVIFNPNTERVTRGWNAQKTVVPKYDIGEGGENDG